MLLSSYHELVQLPCPTLEDPDSIYVSSALAYTDSDQERALRTCVSAAFDNTPFSNRDLSATLEYTSYGCPKVVPNAEFNKLLQIATSRTPYVSFTHETNMQAVWMLVTSHGSSILGTGIDYISNRRARLTFDDVTDQELAYMFFDSEVEAIPQTQDPAYWLAALVSMKEAGFKALSQAYALRHQTTPSISYSFTDLRIELLSQTPTLIQFLARPTGELASLADPLGRVRVVGSCVPHANGYLSQAYTLRS